MQYETARCRPQLDASFFTYLDRQVGGCVLEDDHMLAWFFLTCTQGTLGYTCSYQAEYWSSETPDCIEVQTFQQLFTQITPPALPHST